MDHGDFKDLKTRIDSDKVLGDKAFKLLKILNMMDTAEALLLWFIIFLIKIPLRLQINLYQEVVLIKK